MRKHLLGLAALMLAAATLQTATAQERYPSRSIKFIVPFAAGKPPTRWHGFSATTSAPRSARASSSRTPRAAAACRRR
jgi:hypothetical protein